MSVPLGRAADLITIHKLHSEEVRRRTVESSGIDYRTDSEVALALTDTSFMPRPWELKEQLDLITADFAYVRWLGDRKSIEETTTTWDKAIVDREPDIKQWVNFLQQMVLNKNLRKILAFANNHYAGHAPEVVRLFEKLWAKLT